MPSSISTSSINKVHNHTRSLTTAIQHHKNKDEDDIIQIMHRLLLPFYTASHGTTLTNPNNPKLAYDYLIIQYHKTGHVLARQLTNLIKADTSIKQFDSVLHEPSMPRYHDVSTKCPHVNLHLGQLNIQAAPDFYCDINTLAEELLHSDSNNKRGIKIIHLVRNPLRQAVSNYKYHSQYPTPEAWVKGFDVCGSIDKSMSYYRDLLMPTLGSEGANVMEDKDWDDILQLCYTLTQQQLQPDNDGIIVDYDTHLQTLSRLDGLALATAQLTIGKGGDITRMINNILKLQQLQQLERNTNIMHHNIQAEKHIQVLTLAMDHFIHRPYDTSLRFLNFLLPDDDSYTTNVKERLATEYTKEFQQTLANRGDNSHISTRRSDSIMLEAMLREHELFGKILTKFERVVGEALDG